MFSKEYFKYLIRSHRYLLLLIFLITILNCIGHQRLNHSWLIGLQSLFCVILLYVMPVDVFFHIHDKRAIDTYFALPISRKAMLLTGILFCTACVYLPYSIASIYYFILVKSSFTTVLVFFPEMLLFVLTMIVFNTAIYLIGNNQIDGIIMLGAYTLLPVFLNNALSIFMSSYVCGLVSYPLDFIGYLSPLWTGGSLITELFGNTTHFDKILVLIAFLLASSYLLYRNYVDRKSERASMISDSFLSYPLMISVYTLLVLFIISSLYSFWYDTFIDFFRENFTIYLSVFAVYVAVHFIYKRKTYFSGKMLLSFFLALAIALGLAFAARSTRGFGLSDSYIRNDVKATYMLNSWYNTPEKEISELLQEASGRKPEYISVYVETKDKRKEDLRQESAEVFEKFRLNAIDQFYSSSEKNFMGSLSIISADKTQYNYNFDLQIELNDLLVLAEDPNIYVSIDCDYGVYQLLEDGSLRLVEDYLN